MIFNGKYIKNENATDLAFRRLVIFMSLCICLLLLTGLRSIQTQDLPAVKVTAYRIKGITASGLRTTSIKEPFVAVSRDLLSEYPMGSYIRLGNCKWEGVYKVLDKMGKKSVNTVDVFSRKASGIVTCTCQKISSDQK
ncbi:MAG: hypothetical protein IPN29_12970 [Saprospiraceae bacterium]|nr:hypothetical protein [Saprospiraceae bacterium]